MLWSSLVWRNFASFCNFFFWNRRRMHDRTWYWSSRANSYILRCEMVKYFISNSYCDKMFTLLLHWKRKLSTRQCSQIDTDLMGKNIYFSAIFSTVLRENLDNGLYHKSLFLFHASGHLWGWPRAVVFMRHVGFCNSNLVVGFLIAPSRHSHIKYFVSIRILMGFTW